MKHFQFYFSPQTSMLLFSYPNGRKLRLALVKLSELYKAEVSWW